ncbi:hypothetical protein FHT72_001719 [Rhizobium sp. BK077]|uniref:hypothetical protein n=1 Tax=unclassified Rhizobium TaxID=2613769 RepID=UPI0017EA988A|nr:MULTISPECIES: hypothetical protein [unclassified Rhizobium]MBB3298844.1 hypothetical protein [Rhizobium sp. BK112]MBB3367248.1 hypothetical protein [Rhizobium sp. BK077]MBB4178736.1 hypothetical protein [Rhizobium sp. BK109]
MALIEQDVYIWLGELACCRNLRPQYPKRNDLVSASRRPTQQSAALVKAAGNSLHQPLIDIGRLLKQLSSGGLGAGSPAPFTVARKFWKLPSPAALARIFNNSRWDGSPSWLDNCDLTDLANVETSLRLSGISFLDMTYPSVVPSKRIIGDRPSDMARIGVHIYLDRQV